MAAIYKTFSTDARSGGDRRIRFMISTGSIDRDGDTLNPQGWVLDAYRRSPVVLWAHDYSSPPIAKATNIASTPKGLEAVAEFPPPGVFPFADQIFAMLKDGFLSATSVGFRPIESSANGKGRNYNKQELLEFSVVPVPANPEALMQRGIAAGQAAFWKDYILKGWASPKLGDKLAGALPATPVCHPVLGAEDEQTFLSRCMADSEMAGHFPDEGERRTECSIRWTADTGWPGIRSHCTLEIEDTFEVEPEMIVDGVSRALLAIVDEAMRREIKRQFDRHTGRVS